MEKLISEYKIEIDQVGKDDWSKYLVMFDDATIYQTWSYGAVRWGEKNLSHLILKCDEEIIGIAQSVIKKLPILKAGIAYIPWGPIWRKKGQKANLDHLHQIIAAVKNEYAIQRGLLTRLTLNESEDQNDNILKIFANEGFKRNLSVSPYRTLMIDLTRSIEDLRSGLVQKWRNQLNRAEKNNLDILEGTSNALFEIFLRLQKEMISRKCFLPGVNSEEFRLIQNDLPEPLKMRIVIGTFEGKPVCAAICSAIGDAGIYFLGATGNEGMQLNGSNLLQWRLLQWLKDSGFRWYDLGGINPDRNPGVYRFKANLAGKSGKSVVHLGQFDICTNSISNILIKFAEMIKKLKS